MLQNAPRAPESKIIKLVHSAPNRRKRPLDEAVKFHNRWPFTVAAPFGLMPLEHARLLGHTDNGNFVT